MVRLQAKRLVRSVLFGLLVLLLVGGGTGFAAASTAEDDAGAILPTPRPGDRATYSVEQILVDADRATKHQALPPTEITVEWLAERLAGTPQGTTTVARPLAVTAILHDRERFEFVYEALFDGADGAELSRGVGWSEPYSYQSTPVDVPFFSSSVSGTTSGRTEVFAEDEALAPCGFAHDHHGRQAGAGDVVVVSGGCDIAFTPEGTPFTVEGWTHVMRHKVLRLVHHAPESTLELYIDPDLPVPVRIVARMPELMDETFNEGRAFRADLTGFEPGSGGYTVPAKQPPSPLLPLQAAARQPWMVDDTGILHPFPLREAYAYATDPASYTADQGGESVPQFLASNPDAYLAYAWSAHASGESGDQDAWGLAWVDGEGGQGDWIGKLVSRQGAGVLVGLPVSVPGAPSTTSMVDWDPGFEALGAEFPPAHRLPHTLPTVAQTLGLAQTMLEPHGWPVPNSYGFITACFEEDCFETDVLVTAGHTQYEASTLQSALRDQQAEEAFVAVSSRGQPRALVFARVDQQAPVPLLPAEADPDDYEPVAAASLAAEDVVWAPPSGKAVAGLSLLAVVASALYYFWPAVKGAASHAGLGLFSRIEQGSVLDNPTRRRVHDAITAEPGIHFQALARKTGLGRGNLDHHVRKLVAADLVVLRRAPGYTCYFAKGAVDRHVADAAPALRSDGSRAILQAVAASPGASSRDLAVRLGLAPSTVSYHLKRLESAGLVAPGGRAGVRLTSLGAQSIAPAGTATGPATAAA